MKYVFLNFFFLRKQEIINDRSRGNNLYRFLLRAAPTGEKGLCSSQCKEQLYVPSPRIGSGWMNSNANAGKWDSELNRNNEGTSED